MYELIFKYLVPGTVFEKTTQIIFFQKIVQYHFSTILVKVRMFLNPTIGIKLM